MAQQDSVALPNTVWRALRQLGLGTRIQCLLVLETHSTKSGGLLTKRTRRNLLRRKVRHVQAERPGELIHIDTFYIGKNQKGVGKLWQLTACDAARPYVIAKVIPANSARETASVLRDVVAMEITKAGWRLRRMLADGDSELRTESD